MSNKAVMRLLKIPRPIGTDAQALKWPGHRLLGFKTFDVAGCVLFTGPCQIDITYICQSAQPGKDVCEFIGFIIG